MLVPSELIDIIIKYCPQCRYCKKVKFSHVDRYEYGLICYDCYQKEKEEAMYYRKQMCYFNICTYR